MSAFGMKVVAYDPYVQPARAAQMGVKVLSLDELLEVSDFITVHLPKTPETVGLIGDEALRKVKPSVRIVNAARGGIVDEEALYSALKEGRVAGAGPRRVRQGAVHRLPAVRVRRGRLPPRTWAPPPTRRRRRRASRSPARCASRSPVSWSRTR